jgi:hypothetical protein
MTMIVWLLYLHVHCTYIESIVISSNVLSSVSNSWQAAAVVLGFANCNFFFKSVDMFFRMSFPTATQLKVNLKKPYLIKFVNEMWLDGSFTPTNLQTCCISLMVVVSVLHTDHSPRYFRRAPRPLSRPSAPSTISKMPSCLFRKFFKTYTKAAFLLLKIFDTCCMVLTVVNYRWSKAINLNLRSFILVKDINKK